jgi:F-type H+-transporting ATPase subunit delta
MAEIKVARRYAKSLLGLAQERNISDKVLCRYGVDALLPVRQAASLFYCLRNPIVQGDKKEAVINALFGGRTGCAHQCIAYQYHHRAKVAKAYLDGMAAEYIRIYKDNRGIL